MTDITILFKNTLSLAQLQTEVAAFENLQGPVTEIGRTDAKTAVVYKLGRRPIPTVKLSLAGPVPTGYTKVCDGQAWILGQHQAIMALRKDGVA